MHNHYGCFSCNPFLASQGLRGRKSEQVFTYDLFVTHETLRVAVIKTLSDAAGFKIPPYLISKMQDTFFERFTFYLTVCDKNMKYDGVKYTVSINWDNITVILIFI